MELLFGIIGLILGIIGAATIGIFTTMLIVFIILSLSAFWLLS